MTLVSLLTNTLAGTLAPLRSTLVDAAPVTWFCQSISGDIDPTALNRFQHSSNDFNSAPCEYLTGDTSPTASTSCRYSSSDLITVTPSVLGVSETDLRSTTCLTIGTCDDSSLRCAGYHLVLFPACVRVHDVLTLSPPLSVHTTGT